MNSSEIAAVASYHLGGLGDFIRGALALFVVAEQHGCRFQIDMTQRPELAQAFADKDSEEPASQYKKAVELGVIDQPISAGPGIRAKLHELLWHSAPNEPVRIAIRTNFAQLCSPRLLVDAIPRFRVYLKPSSITLARQIELRTALRVVPKQFVAVHIRAGDHFMDGRDVRCKDDIRAGILNDVLLTKFVKQIDFAMTQPALSAYVHKPVVIYTDSVHVRVFFKRLVSTQATRYQIRVLETEIQHTAAMSNVPGHTSSFIDTIAEFFTMMDAQCIIQLSYSGFAHWAALLANIPLYSFASHPLLEFMQHYHALTLP